MVVHCGQSAARLVLLWRAEFVADLTPGSAVNHQTRQLQRDLTAGATIFDTSATPLLAGVTRLVSGAAPLAGRTSDVAVGPDGPILAWVAGDAIELAPLASLEEAS